MFTSKGIIKYNPYRGSKSKSEWWAVVDVDTEITRYYRWWVEKNHWIKMYEPSWNAHISIVKGPNDKPKREFEHLWKKYDGKEIEFEYSHEVHRCSNGAKHKKSDVFWIVRVECPFLVEIRKEMDLPHDWNLHLTIGRTYY